jgi:hypothetical protein
MEQGPDELGDRADERAEQLERLTEAPLDEEDVRRGDGAEPVSQDNLDKIDPGM